MLTGLRGVGKTVLLNEIERRAVDSLILSNQKRPPPRNQGRPLLVYFPPVICTEILFDRLNFLSRAVPIVAVSFIDHAFDGVPTRPMLRDLLSPSTHNTLQASMENGVESAKKKASDRRFDGSEIEYLTQQRFFLIVFLITVSMLLLISRVIVTLRQMRWWISRFTVALRSNL